MKKISIIGNNHFGSILTKQLNEFDDKNRYVFFNTNEKTSDKIKFLLSLPSIDVVYSVSGSIHAGGALNLALMLNKKIVQHFIGSDVLTAIDNYKNRHFNKNLMEKSRYLCEVDWIQNELATIAIKADIASIATYNKNVIPKEFNSFSVLTYMSRGKEEFYGMADLIKLAKYFDDITFKVAGIKSYEKSLPDNIHLLGWVDMDKEFQECSCYIRNAKHDGLAFSILEALGYGRVVFYNYKFPYTNSFSTFDELRNKLFELRTSFEKQELCVNHEAIDFIQQEYSKEKVLGNLVKILTNEEK